MRETVKLRRKHQQLIRAAYRRAGRYGLMIKTVLYTGVRVSEFVNLRVVNLHLSPPQIHSVHDKGGSDGYVPILPALAQKLRIPTSAGRRTGDLFGSNRQRAVSFTVKDTARRAGIDKTVTPHRHHPE
ncbi:tyrosine-type recombinase/integrase [Deinococcus oregonensis]|uniref:Tyrosine-type recombinase/integrase n=1 Tax=Deinococcus oregonensis TaxID=1805970 RepID=A0ABV6B8W7_9DEIO